MGLDDSSVLHTWIDASYAVHPDIRGQSDGVILMGHGAVTQKLTKQKLNAKSSTETEVIDMSDMLPHSI